MSSKKESSMNDTEGEEEYSVEKVIDKRMNKGKVCLYSFLLISF